MKKWKWYLAACIVVAALAPMLALTGVLLFGFSKVYSCICVLIGVGLFLLLVGLIGETGAIKTIESAK